MKIHVEQQGLVFVLHLAGEADLPSVPDLLVALHQVLEEGRRVVVDISELDFCSFSVLSALDRWRVACSVGGGDLRVAGLTPRLRAVLTRIGMIDLFVTEPAGDKAIEYVGLT